MQRSLESAAAVVVGVLAASFGNKPTCPGPQPCPDCQVTCGAQTCSGPATSVPAEVPREGVPLEWLAFGACCAALLGFVWACRPKTLVEGRPIVGVVSSSLAVADGGEGRPARRLGAARRQD